jgi:DNA modification methylase
MILELNEIICGDALEVLKTLPHNSVNCIVTSPPYYCLRDYCVAGQIGLEASPEKYIENLTKVFSECYRVLKNDGTLWVVIGDSYAGSGRGWGGKNDLYCAQYSAKGEFCNQIFKTAKTE